MIFTTDNGPAASQEPESGMSLTSQGVTGPFRGKKASLYEGGQRVPFIITGPGVLRNHVEDSLASNVRSQAITKIYDRTVCSEIDCL